MGQFLFKFPRSAGEMTGFRHLNPYPREIFYCEVVWGGGGGKEQSFDL